MEDGFAVSDMGAPNTVCTGQEEGREEARPLAVRIWGSGKVVVDSA